MNQIDLTKVYPCSITAILLFYQIFSLQNLSVTDSHCQIIINPQTYHTMNGNSTYVYITKAMKQSTYLNMLDNIRYMLLIPTTPVYIRELVQNKSVKKVCILHDLIGFVKIKKSPQIHIK